MEHSENTCPVCSEQIGIYSVGACDHPICYKCATRMRVLCTQMYCPICRTDLPQVGFVNKLEKYEALNLRSWNSYRKCQIFFQDKDISNKFFELLDHKCPLCKNRPPDRFLQDLSRHMRREHEKFYCDLCVEHLKIFTHQRKYYDRKELALHRREGDPGDSAYKGHPLCRFCDVRFLDNDELARHLRKEHYYCHFCDTDGSHQYYSEYPVLMEHFREQHYLCDEGECLDAQFTHAFRSEIDLKAHKANCHSRGMKRSFTKQARTIDVEFPLAPRGKDFERGRGRRGYRGGRRDQATDDNRYGNEEEDVARAIEASLVPTSIDHGGKKEKREKPGRYRKPEQKEEPKNVPEEKINHDAKNFPTLSGKASPTMDKDLSENTVAPSSDSGELSDSIIPSMAHKLAMSERFSVQSGAMSTDEFPSLRKAATVPATVQERGWVSGRNSPIAVATDRDFPALGRAARPVTSSQHSPKPQHKTSYANPKPAPVVVTAHKPERSKPTPVTIPAYEPERQKPKADTTPINQPKRSNLTSVTVPAKEPERPKPASVTVPAKELERPKPASITVAAYQPERPKPAQKVNEPRLQRNDWTGTRENDFPGLPQPAHSNNSTTQSARGNNASNKREKDFPGLPTPIGGSNVGRDFPSLPSSSRPKPNNKQAAVGTAWPSKQPKGQVVGIVKNSRPDHRNDNAEIPKPSTLADIGKALHDEADHPILGGKNLGSAQQPVAKAEVLKKSQSESPGINSNDTNDSKSKNKKKKKKQKEKENSDIAESDFSGYPDCSPTVSAISEDAKLSNSAIELTDYTGEDKENNGVNKSSITMTLSGQSSSSERNYGEPWMLVQPTKLLWTMVDSVEDFPTLVPQSSKKSVPPGLNASPPSKPPPGFSTKISPSRPPPGLGKPIILSPSNVMQPTDIEYMAKLEISDVPKFYSKPEGFSERNKRLITEIRTILAEDPDKFSLFKTWSTEFRQASISAAEYYDKCAHLLGKEKYLTIFSELLSLLPDIEKQQELLAAHTATEEQGMKAGKIKKAGWNTSVSPFTTCPFCQQVLVSEDRPPHLAIHDADADFPTLVSAESQKGPGLSAWVRAK